MRDAPPIVKHVVWVVVIGGVILPAAWFLWQPQGDLVINYVPKALFILVVGLVGLMQLARVIGWCVGWLLDPTTSHAGRDNRPAASGDERVFHVSRWRETVIALGCIGLVGFFVWSFDHLNPVMAVIGVPTFAPWVFAYGMQALFPSRLALRATGFEVKHWSGPLERVAWADVEPIYVWGVSPALVSYRYREGRGPARLGWAGRWYRARGVGDGTIPTGLPIDSEALCGLMNQMRGRTLVGEAAAPATLGHAKSAQRARSSMPPLHGQTQKSWDRTLFSRTRTYILAIVVSALTMLFMGYGCAALQSALFPWPPGTSVDNPASTAAAVAAMPLAAKLLLVAEWSASDFAIFAVAMVANALRRSILWAVWIFPLIATGANYSEYPYPTWMIVAGAVAIPVAAWAAYRVLPSRNR